jgi:hypothetical protein
MSSAALKPLKPYEPYRDLHRFVDVGGQLALDLLPMGDPSARAADELDPPLPLSHVRSVVGAILEVRTGRRPLGQLQGLVHPRLYRQLGMWTQIKGIRFTLKSVRGCRLTSETYEVSGTAHTPTRAYAVMARFELTEPGWRCTFFDLITPPKKRP